MSRILLIDDDEMVRVAICTMLQRAGHEVAVAVDGVDGLDQVERADFDLVLCDVFMPRMDGIATLKELRRRRAATPVVMMSAGSPRAARIGRQEDMDYLGLSLALGATQVIEKPFRSDQLNGLVEQVLVERPPLH
jgi:CheY-like chemotaxis protein